MPSGIPPGPSYPSWIQSIGFWTRPLAFLERCRARYGKRFTIRLPLAPPFVMISDPDEVKRVFTAPPDVLHPGEGARVLEPVVGTSSVILLDEAAHLEQRKLMLPAFHGEKMERLSDLIAEVADREVASWPRGEPFRLGPRLQRLTMEIILRAVFGLDPGERLDGLRERLSAMLAFGDRPISLLPPPPGRLQAILERRGPFAGFVRLQEQADELLFELIDERRAEHAERDDILSLLLDARHEDESPMSPQELRDELMTLLIAGHETTASTLAWTFERLVRLPDVLGRLRQEIGGSDGDAYITATVQEALRRRPVLPNAAPRLVKQPIEVGGWSYPVDVCLVPNAYLVHHDPEIYSDPYTFRPERFLKQSPGTYTWIPFGGGRRRCIGASFAMLEMKIVIRSVLERQEVAPAGPLPERARRRNITITPDAGSRVTLSAPQREPVRTA
ncbi:MAG TPA: cytochrome P450 [Solirubrobacterales bacterium]|nr:cytochrome P450 [Solirubrobacterales bacterium]